MNLQFNKNTAQILSILFIALIGFGTSTVFFILAGINNIPLSDLAVRDIIVQNLKISISYLGNLIIGIWFFLNAEKLNQDKWTWVLIGLVGGQYSLILLLMSALVQRTDKKQDLFKLFLNIIVLLILATGIQYIPKSWFKPGPELLLNYALLNKSALVTTTPLIVNLVYTAGLNIFFARKINILLNCYKIEKKGFWIIATLITGLFSVILVHNLVLFEKKISVVPIEP